MSKATQNKLRRKVHQLKVKTIRPDHLSSKIGIGTPTLPKTMEEDISTIAFSKKIGGQYSQFYKLQKNLKRSFEEIYYNAESRSPLPLSVAPDVIRLSLAEATASAELLPSTPIPNPPSSPPGPPDMGDCFGRSFESTIFGDHQNYVYLTLRGGFMKKGATILDDLDLLDLPVGATTSYPGGLDVLVIDLGTYKFINTLPTEDTLQVIGDSAWIDLYEYPEGYEETCPAEGTESGYETTYTFNMSGSTA